MLRSVENPDAWFSYVADIGEVYRRWLLMSEILCEFFPWMITNNKSPTIGDIELICRRWSAIRPLLSNCLLRWVFI